jgi:peptide chain release factor 1
MFKKTIKISKELNSLEEVYNLYISWRKVENEIKESKDIISNETDDEIVEMAKEQLEEANKEKEKLEAKLKIALLPKDENDDKNIYMEIRPAAGGDESALFAEEMLRMYMRYAENM